MQKLPFQFVPQSCTSDFCSLDATKTVFTFYTEAAEAGIYGYALSMLAHVLLTKMSMFTNKEEATHLLLSDVHL